MAGTREEQRERMRKVRGWEDKSDAEIDEIIAESEKRGTCGFCGFGGGYLGEQGDEGTQYLHSAVRVGEPGHWQYEGHPNETHRAGTVTWCGHCVGGLAHKYQRYDDVNLNALLISTKVRLSLDAPRWEFWEVDRDSDERQKLIDSGYPPDDQAVHLDKLRDRRDVQDMTNEQFRRAGADLTARGWRP